MASDKDPRPGDEAAARRQRQAAALRENLRRRKAQSRARDEAATVEQGAESHNPPSTARKP